MNGCVCESWNLKKISDALQNKQSDNKKIVIPMFQRGKRWTPKQEEALLDSIRKGYPIGTMLFYRTITNNQEIYILVDGLQRGNSIKKYITEPTRIVGMDSITDELCYSICSVLGINGTDLYSNIKKTLYDFVKKQKGFENVQFFSPASQLVEKYCSSASNDKTFKLIQLIAEQYKKYQDLYKDICAMQIPVVIYTGDESNLPKIFERINSKGTALNKYEVYAASWPLNQTYQIKNKEIVNLVISKYTSLTMDGFEIDGFSAESMYSTQRLSIFEYIFGLSKYLVEKYEFLAFGGSLKVDEVNPLGFELVNACYNDLDKIGVLYQNFTNTDVNNFEKALICSVEFVQKSISIITRFKGNNQNRQKILHSKFQILSMIAAVFREMWDGIDYSKYKESWVEKRPIIEKNLLKYYVYDIITNYWSEGGTSKIFSVLKPNRYLNDIPSRSWAFALNSFYEKSMQRLETVKPASPEAEEYVFLNCVYLNTFSAMDQLSMESFDVEHIATKKQMKNLIEICRGDGLPISSIANLCYLPSGVNRSKQDKNFYQDKNYLDHIDLTEVEKKYSFTVREDLEWMEMPYAGAEDFQYLKSSYFNYCEKRFRIMEKYFCEALEINYDEFIIPEDIERASNTVSREMKIQEFRRNKEKNKKSSRNKVFEKVDSVDRTDWDVKLYCKCKNAVTGIVTDSQCLFDGERFIVLKGSLLSLTVTGSIGEGLKEARESANIDERGILQENIAFKSASAASKFVVGRSSNGKTEWKTEDGVTFISWINSHNNRKI